MRYCCGQKMIVYYIFVLQMSFFCVRNKCIYACTLHIDICTQKSTNIKNCHIYSRIKILWPSFVVCIDTKCICIFKNLLIINNNNCCVYTHVNTHICKQSQEANSRCCFSGTTHLEFLGRVSMAWNWASRLGSWPGSPRTRLLLSMELQAFIFFSCGRWDQIHIFLFAFQAFTN